MILDAHVHLGEDVVFDEVQTEQQLEEFYAKYNVDGGIIQPYIGRPYLEDTRQIHDRIAAFVKSSHKRWWGMASINPHFRPEDYDSEAKRCVKDLGFVGLKITPIAHACHPSSKDAFHVFEIARSLSVPLMIHTGAGIPFSDPISVVKGLEYFKDVVVVLAHAGSEMHNQQATYLAEKFENVFLEPSWVGVIGVGVMIKKVGSSKVMFSSDNIYQIPVELAKYHSILSDKNDLENVLYKNVASVYKLNI
ncbi:MAG: amidohydrolase family protein [Deltaproteobacteria bacterium]|nr:amidohydrolase family protein [Deltaproteobacteria bacterium]